MALPIPPVYYSAQEYLAFEREADYKSEYLDGQIFAMSGGSPDHSTIIVNVISELHPQLKIRSCRAFSSDTKVRTPSDSLYAYPDLTVVCGEPRFYDPLGHVLDNPTLIIEVLSPSTEAFDRGKKFARYQEIESLTDYVLIAQDEPRIEHCERRSGKEWLVRPHVGLNSEVVLASIGATLSLTNVYYLIDFSSRGAPNS